MASMYILNPFRLNGGLKTFTKKGRSVKKRKSKVKVAKKQSKSINLYKGKNMAKRRRKRKSYKANAKRKSYKRNPSRIARTSRKRKSYRRNPSPIGAMTKKENVISALALGGGLVIGLKAQKYLHSLSFSQSWRKLNGVIPLALGILLAIKGKKDIAKKLGWGIATSGVYDLVSQNIPQLSLMPVEGVDMDGTQTYDAPIMGAQTFDAPQMGETMVLGNTEIIGENEPGAGMYSL